MLNHDARTRLVTVSEAATVYACSVETVRRRLRSGNLTGQRNINGRGKEVWWVAVPVTTPMASVEPKARTVRSASSDAPDDADSSTVLVGGLRAIIDELRGQMAHQAQIHAGEVARMTAMLEDRRVEVHHLHRIVERMSAPMLPPPAVDTPAPKPWWRLW